MEDKHMAKTRKMFICVLTLLFGCFGLTQAAVIYEDSFSYTGPLNGVVPDVTTTGGNAWTEISGGANASGGVARASGAGYAGATLSVNGSSGVSLDGSKDFDLSADIVITGAGSVNLLLGNATQGVDWVRVQLSSSNVRLYVNGSSQGLIAYTTGQRLALLYDQSEGTIDVELDGTSLSGRFGLLSVASTDISEMTSVGFRFQYNNIDATLDNFRLNVVPEPATASLLGLGGLLLAARRRRS
jgi:hypothetical protein